MLLKQHHHQCFGLSLYILPITYSLSIPFFFSKKKNKEHHILLITIKKINCTFNHKKNSDQQQNLYSYLEKNLKECSIILNIRLKMDVVGG